MIPFPVPRGHLFPDKCPKLFRSLPMLLHFECTEKWNKIQHIINVTYKYRSYYVHTQNYPFHSIELFFSCHWLFSSCLRWDIHLIWVHSAKESRAEFCPIGGRRMSLENRCCFFFFFQCCGTPSTLIQYICKSIFLQMTLHKDSTFQVTSSHILANAQEIWIQ